MVKGCRFRDFRDTGDPVSAAKVYNHQDADELMFIDIEASRGKIKERQVLYEVIERVSEECFMPLTVGGGVDSLKDIINLLTVGADKVIINTAAVKHPELIREAFSTVGSQCVVVGVDVMKQEGRYVIYTNCAQIPRPEITLEKYIHQAEEFGAGEILINSIDNDGMMQGYDLELLKMVRLATSLPLIACGGAGNFNHLSEAFEQAQVDAVACASLFHFGDNNPLRAKAFLKNQNIPVKLI